MGLLLDSSVLIEAERGRLDLGQRLSAAPEEPIALAAITASELLHGVHRARRSDRRARRERFVEWVLAQIPVAEFGLAEARAHARVWASLEARGTPVGAHDLLIAATAIALGFRLATANAREFDRIPELPVEDWGARP